MHEIIFEAETPAGKAFDLFVLAAIVISVTAVILESVDRIGVRYADLLHAIEWICTLLFTVEYGLRLLCVKEPKRYAKSFFGIVDLVAILPTYLSLVFAGSQMLLVVRVLRMLRIFRIFKLIRFSVEAETLLNAIRASRAKVVVFLGTVITVATIMGTLMYLIEGPENGFINIPAGVYWAIVTMTTVGFGDIVPATVLGKTLASLLMIMGYGLIAVPTGIVSVELAHATRLAVSTNSCRACLRAGHDLDAVHCRFCGEKL
ncbi:MAG: ion transporter [Candidatus Omnitrophica bacterium]|nr:ion transporter [Candidatus Omnitrophota bacterium]